MPRFKVGQLVRLGNDSRYLGRVVEVSIKRLGSEFLYGVQWMGLADSNALYAESELDPFQNAGVIA
jgi:hypothetical protein